MYFGDILQVCKYLRSLHVTPKINHENAPQENQVINDSLWLRREGKYFNKTCRDVLRNYLKLVEKTLISSNIIFYKKIEEKAESAIRKQ